MSHGCMACLLHPGTRTNSNLSIPGVLLVVFGYKALDGHKHVLVLPGGVGGKERAHPSLESAFPSTCPMSLTFPLIFDFFQSLNFKHCFTFTSQFTVIFLPLPVCLQSQGKNFPDYKAASGGSASPEHRRWFIAKSPMTF